MGGVQIITPLFIKCSKNTVSAFPAKDIGIWLLTFVFSFWGAERVIDPSGEIFGYQFGHIHHFHRFLFFFNLHTICKHGIAKRACRRNYRGLGF